MENLIFDKIFESFKSHFPPGNKDDYSLKLGTQELFTVFARFYPGEFSQEELFNKMISENYCFEPESRSGTIKFSWLLKPISQANGI